MTNIVACPGLLYKLNMDHDNIVNVKDHIFKYAIIASAYGL